MEQRRHWIHFIWQPLLAVAFLCATLYVLGRLTESDILWAVGAGSLSSSSFSVFGNPSSAAAAPHRIIGGYLIGMLCGELMRAMALLIHPLIGSFLQSPHFHILGMFAAIAVGLALLLMSLLKLQHPPAAGMALVLVLDVRHYYVLAIIFATALALSLIKVVLNRYLKDLS